MGVDAKEIQVFLWRILKFSMSSACRFVQTHPFVSGVLSLFFLLYLFLPTIFYLFVYSSPFIVSAAVLIRIRLNNKHPKTQNFIRVERDDHRKSSAKSESFAADPVIDRRDKCSMRSLSRRRNVKGNFKEWDAQGGTDEKERPFLVTPVYDLMGVSALIEEKQKPIAKEEEIFSLDHEENSSQNEPATGNTREFMSPEGFDDPMENSSVSGDSGGGSCGIGEVEEEGLEEAEYEDEEQSQGIGNKALEWTEDDQKNLMDLGLSELERNKRLESLMTKRRARKLFKMAVEKSLMGSGSPPQGHIAPILIARSNPFDVPLSPNGVGGGLQMPGSAPSVLLPIRNPFDIPYDPFEERPNLMADSFHQEFMAADQKDIFCRHGSFSLGPPLPLGATKEQKGPKLDSLLVSGEKDMDGLRYSRFRKESDKGNHDQLVEELLAGEDETKSQIEGVTYLIEQRVKNKDKQINSVELKHEEDQGETGNGMIEIKGHETTNAHYIDSGLQNTNEVKPKTNSSEEKDSESSSPYSSEHSEQSFRTNKAEVSKNTEVTFYQFPEVISDPLRDCLACSFSNSNGANGPSCVSSPFANDNPRMADQLFFADRGPCHTPTYSIASDMQVEVSEVGSSPATVDGSGSSDGEEFLTRDEEVNRENVSESKEMSKASSYIFGVVEEHKSRSREVTEANKSSWSPSLNESLKRSEAHSIDFGHLTIEDVKQVDGAEEGESSNSSNTTSRENQERTTNLMELSLAQPQNQVLLGKEEVSSDPPEKFSEKVRVNYDVENLVHEYDDLEDLRSLEDGHRGAKNFLKQEALDDLSKPVEEIKEESSNYNSEIATNPAEHQDVLDSEKLMENKGSKYIEDSEGDSKYGTKEEFSHHGQATSQELSEHQSVLDSEELADNKNSNLIEDIEGKAKNLVENQAKVDVLKLVDGDDKSNSIQGDNKEKGNREITHENH